MSQTTTPALAINGGPQAMTLSIPRTLHGVTEIGQPEIDAVVKVLERKTIFRFLNDEETSESALFEKAYREYTGSPFALGVCGGTGALITGLVGLGVSTGDEVIIPGYTYIATAAACLTVGAIPIVCEVDESLTMDPADLEKKITPYTKAIIPVHMRGTPCDMDAIMTVAQKHGLKVLEDVAQANGGEYKGEKLGAIGDAGAFSFQHYKMITAGEAGILLAKEENVFKRAAIRHDSAMQFWKDDESWESFAGENFRLSEMHAALGLVQFERLPGILDKCRAVKQRLHAELEALPHINLQRLPDAAGDCSIMFAFFLNTAEQAKRFSEVLHAEGLPNGTIYNKSIPDRHIYANWDYVINKQTSDTTGWPWTSAQREIEYSRDMLPQTLDLLDRCISLGISQHWTDEMVDQVVASIKKVHDALTEAGEIG